MQISALRVHLQSNPLQTSTKPSLMFAVFAVECPMSADDCTQPCALVLDASAAESFLQTTSFIMKQGTLLMLFEPIISAHVMLSGRQTVVYEKHKICCFGRLIP